MAIAAVGLGSVLASTQLNRAPGIQATEATPAPRSSADFALNGGRSQQLKELALTRALALENRPGRALLP